MAGKQMNGKASSIPAGLGAGAGVSVVITLAGTAVLAKMLDAETIQWESIGYGILIMIMLSAMLGSLTAIRKVKRQFALVSLMSGFVYWGILLSITALFFGGQYEAVGVTLLLVAAGSGCAFLLTLQGGRGGSTKHRRRQHTRYSGRSK